MKLISNVISVASISLLLLVSFNLNAAEKEDKNEKEKTERTEKRVSQKIINKKGFKIKVEGKTFIITKITNKKSPKKACSLDASGLGFLTLKAMPRKGAKAEISLQAKVGKKGHPYCSGKGNGCTMTVEIPDAEEPPKKILK